MKKDIEFKKHDDIFLSFRCNGNTKKTFMKTFIKLFILTLFVSNCSSDDNVVIPPTNNMNPGIFSANTIDIRFDGATIEWTEAIDPDGDTVTYAIYLDGIELTTGVLVSTYNFTGLEAETSYEGYVEARDGNGGTSQAPFFFTTDPEVIIQTIEIEYRYWEGGGGYGIVNYFEVAAIDDAISYHLEILDYSPDPIPSNVGRTYTWTPDSDLPTGNNVGSGASHLTEYTPGIYHANTSTGSGSLIYLNDAIAYASSVMATARLTVIVGESNN